MPTFRSPLTPFQGLNTVSMNTPKRIVFLKKRNFLNFAKIITVSYLKNNRIVFNVFIATE